MDHADFEQKHTGKKATIFSLLAVCALSGCKIWDCVQSVTKKHDHRQHHRLGTWLSHVTSQQEVCSDPTRVYVREKLAKSPLWVDLNPANTLTHTPAVQQLPTHMPPAEINKSYSDHTALMNLVDRGGLQPVEASEALCLSLIQLTPTPLAFHLCLFVCLLCSSSFRSRRCPACHTPPISFFLFDLFIIQQELMWKKAY